MICALLLTFGALQQAALTPDAVIDSEMPRHLAVVPLEGPGSGARLIGLYQSGRLDLDSLITARRPLEEINEAMADLSASRGIRTVLSL